VDLLEEYFLNLYLVQIYIAKKFLHRIPLVRHLVVDCYFYHHLHHQLMLYLNQMNLNQHLLQNLRRQKDFLVLLLQL
tara:strand:- start:303 stop:533 length:231 start_codon:yes stop_codon:yes gene_type:complete